MPRSKTVATEESASGKPSKTAHLFRKAKVRSPITSHQIAEDLERFHKAGGSIEMLGVTHVLKNIQEADQAPPRAAWPLPRKSGRTP